MPVISAFFIVVESAWCLVRSSEAGGGDLRSEVADDPSDDPVNFVQMTSPFRCQIRIQMLAVFGPVELADRFRARSLRVSEKLCEFLVGSSIEALRYIVHDGPETSVQLIKQGEVPSKAAVATVLPKEAIQLPGRLPCFDLRETFPSHFRGGSKFSQKTKH